MSFLKSNSLARKAAVALTAMAGVLLFAGGAWAADGDSDSVKVSKAVDTLSFTFPDTVDQVDVYDTTGAYTFVTGVIEDSTGWTGLTSHDSVSVEVVISNFVAAKADTSDGGFDFMLVVSKGTTEDTSIVGKVVIAKTDTPQPGSLTAGNSGTITTSNVTSTGLTLSWGAATGGSDAITYDVYQSASNNIDSVANAVANGTKLNTGGALSVTTLAVTGLTAGTTYYFNVVASDTGTSPAKVAYTIKSQATSAAATVTSVTVSPSQLAVVAPTAGTITRSFTATVVASGGAATTVTWSVTGTTGTSGGIDASTGVLTIGVGATGTITVTATSTADNSKSASATVSVGLYEGTVSITGGATPKVGYALTAVANITTPASGTVTYAWKNASDTLAKTSSYTPKWTDFGKPLTVYVVKGAATFSASVTGNVTADALVPAALLLKDSTVVSYSAGNSYTVDGPKISETGYSIDTIIYSVTGGSAALGAVTSKGAKFTIAATGVQKVVLTAEVRGKKSNVPWHLTGVRVPVTIIPKKLSSSDIKFEEIKGKTVTYSGLAVVTTAGTTLLVKDGTTLLEEGQDYEVDSSYRLCNDGRCNNTDAGDAYLTIRGSGTRGVYSLTDFAVGKYTIGKKPITVIASKFKGKQYDGTTTVPKDSIEVTFVDTVLAADGAAADSALKLTRDFTISNAVYSSKEVGTGLTGTATVALTANGLVSKNYSLASGAITRPGLEITKRTPFSANATDSLIKGDTLTFKYAAGLTHYDMSRSNPSLRRGIGTVTLRDPMANPGGTLTVLYGYGTTAADFNGAGTTSPFGGDTTRAPIKAGTYTVKVKIGGNGTNIDTTAGATFILGQYEILDPIAPSIDVDTISAVTVRQGRTAALSVTASSPNNGVLSYQWWESKETGDSKVGSNSSTFAAPTSSMGTRTYYVIVTNSKSGVQDPAYDTSSIKTVEVIEPPATLNSANGVVQLSKATWTYNGYQQALGGADVVVSYLKKDETGAVDSVTLEENRDYTLAYSNAINVGTATLRVTGVNDYAGSLTKTFTIAKKEVEAFDFTFVEERAYTGDSTKSADVKLVTPLSNNGGAVTVYYDDGSGKKTAVPVNVGNYDVIIDVTAGANLTAGTDLYLGAYVITKGVLDTACFTYSIPAGHKEDQTVGFGIGNVTWKKGTGYGSFEIMYNGDTTVPNVNGVYTVTAEITGGVNFDEGSVVLGTYAIGAVSVAGNDRVIPGGKVVEEAAIAPVKVIGSSFAVGPNVVSKATGKVSFFSGKQVKSGSLYIFDANGNAVAKIAAKQAGKEVATWNLKSKGAAVAEGTYVVKGALVGKDGTKEKVSSLFTVTK